MYSSSICVLTVVTTVLASPFFESPHNERAVPFYKVPINRDFSSPSSYNTPAPPLRPQSFRPQASPVYRPQASPAYRPQAVPAYRPEPSFSRPSYAGGATSFQTVRLEGGNHGYGEQNKAYF